jgi:long-subunit fatty acid transport protein
MKKGLLLGLSLAIGFNANAQISKVGTTGACFLKIYAEPRGTGMGGACIATADDATAMYWNPAGIAFMKKPGFLLTDMKWIVDIRNTFAAFVIPMGLSGVLGVSITALTMGKEDVTTVAEPEGTGETFGASSIALGLSYAKLLTDKFAFGTTAKLIQERIWDVSSTGFAVDFGTSLEISKSLRGAFVITNFGTDMCFKGGHLSLEVDPYEWPEGWTDKLSMERQASSYPLPLAFHMGVAYDVIAKPQNRFTLGAVLSHPNDGSEKLKFGGEYSLREMLFLRAGFKYDKDVWEDIKDEVLTEDDIENEPISYKLRYGTTPSFGAGVKASIGSQAFMVNYALYNVGRLGFRNQISLDVGF